jgi:hypothetical protein
MESDGADRDKETRWARSEIERLKEKRPELLTVIDRRAHERLAKQEAKDARGVLYRAANIAALAMQKQRDALATPLEQTLAEPPTLGRKVSSWISRYTSPKL